MKAFLRRLFGSTAKVPAALRTGARPLVTEEEVRGRRRGVNVTSTALAHVSPYTYGGQALEVFTLPEPPAGVVARGVMLDGQELLAMDDMTGLDSAYAGAAYSSYFKEGLGFLGYPYLSELSQRAEYRKPVEITAKEMTRKWVKFTVAGGDASKNDRIAQLEDAFKKFRVRDLFKKAAEGDGYFGRAQLFVDTGDNRDPQELMRPLIADPRKLEPGFLRGFRYVEPIWSYPAAFNATDPLEEDFYKAPSWFVQAKSVHASRLMTFVSRPMPDILKPAYCFGGLALTQMAKPYVDNWLETRQSVNDLIQAFSQPVLKTDMSAVLEGGGADGLLNRVDFFNKTRSNRSTMVLDKDAEDFVVTSAPLSGLDKLQAQAQEHMAAVTSIPLVVLLGVTPSGLNASSDGEIRVFYQWIKDMQEQLFGPHVQTVLALVQLHLWGEIDPAIGYEFVSLWEDDDTAKAGIQKTNAETHQVYINAGVIAPEEVRETLAADETSLYQGVDLSGPPPEPPADPSQEGDPDHEDDDDGGPPGGGGGQAEDAWTEGDHPRDEAGRFAQAVGSVGAKQAHADFARAQRPIPGESFNASAYAGEHDREGVTPDDVIAQFPPATVALIHDVTEKVKTAGQTIDRHRMSGQGSEAIYTAERDALQRKVLEEPFTDAEGRVHPPIINPSVIKAATPKPGERPKMILLGGRGGSGKSGFKNRVYDPDRFLVLDPDEIKQRLPEYKGWNANEVHEESADIMDGLLDYARAKGLNVVVDATLKSLPQAMARLEAFKGAGYETEAHYMHLPRQVAAERAVQRFLTDKNDGSGRFVPPHVVLANTANERNFDEVRKHVDRWSFYDNHNRTKEEGPKLISAS